jgi:outer membrane immunogenic protein
MKKLVLAAGVAAFLTASGPIRAADVARPIVKAPAPAAAQNYNWTGLYFGGGFGYGMYNLDTQWFAAGLPFTFPLTQTQGGRGWLGTVTAGADYQFNDKIVAGVFGDYDFASIKGTLQNQGPFSIGTTKETSAWAVGARIGWLFNPAILTYFNGGYAQAHFSQADMVLGEISDPASGSVVSSIPSHTYRGWFLGSGIEARLDSLGPFARGWSWRTEYRYADYRSATLSDVCTNPTACPGSPFVGVPVGTALSTVSVHPIVQTVRSELVYKFNWGNGPAGSAYAAPLIVKTPHLLASVYNWTGLYIGGGFGYGLYNADTTFAGVFDPFTVPVTQTQGGRGWLGILTAGADYQFNDKIVAGVFGDYDFASIKGTLPYQTPFETGTMKETAAWAIGARVGWLFDPGVLTYINGGYTQARFSEVNLAINNPGSAFFGAAPETIAAHTYSGWFLGSGIEARLDSLGPFARGWSWRTEYRYSNYRSATLPVVCTDAVICPVPPIVIPVGTTVANISIRPIVQTVRSELVYKFNWGG